MRARIRPRSITKLKRPPEVARLLTLLDDEIAIDLVDCSPTFLRGLCWKVALIDASGVCSGHRYDQFATRAGLALYAFYSKPLRSSEGISVALVVGPRR